MSIVEELENSIDIVELVSKYTKLTKSWANYKALCPFPGHNEKTPSFMVSPTKQLAYCFWCHKWWGALKFIMDIENLEFKEAIQILANFAWKKLEWFDFKKEKIKKNIYSLYKDATNYYKQALEKNPEIKKYLFDRWLNNEIINKFNFWYSDSGLALYNYLKEKWYDDKLISDSKIFVDIKNRKDKFIWRIIFPIQNLRWDIVAFTARIVWKWEPKYLNSPTTPWFDKSSILYWLYQAKQEIVKKDFVIIVEWQMDVISMQSKWFINTVWVSGTALTEKHLNIIKRLTNKIYLCFDWDSAWQKATKLAIETAKNKDIEIKIISLPAWKDPDEILNSWEDFEKYIKNALSPIWYYIENSNFDLNSIEDKKRLLKNLVEIIKTFSNPVEQDFYLKELAKKLDLREKIVYDYFNKLRFKRERIEKTSKKSFSSEDLAIWYLLLDYQKYNKIFNEKIIFKNKLKNELKEALENKLILNNLNLEKQSLYKAITLQLENENSNKNEEQIEKDIEKIIQKINSDSFKKEAEALKEKMNSWDEKAFLEYSKIISLAKKYNIK